MHFSQLLKSVFVAERLNIIGRLQISRLTFNAPSEHFIGNQEENNVLHSTSEDLSEITSPFPQSYNLAAYVNSSETLQNLLHLNVNLSKIEKKPYIAAKIIKLNFEEDVKERLMFLKDYVDVDYFGNFLTKNPLILCEEVEDLQTRVNYLESKHFKHNEICRIITKNPFWLMLSTVRIDKRLGYYQEKFDLCGNEVRFLATKQPKLITYNLHHVKTNSFVIKEEMGFKDFEVKKLILSTPNLWMISQKSLLQRLNYIHNVIKIPHEKIVCYPNILLSRTFKIKQRHVFLQKLGKAQYDPTLENYIPLSALVEDTDVEFCKMFAKCHVDDFNTFLKTM